MNHTTKYLLLTMVLILLVVIVGVLIGQEGLTGATISQITSCYNDEDCNDRSSNTVDTCKNPGTEYSLCVNKPLER